MTHQEIYVGTDLVLRTPMVGTAVRAYTLFQVNGILRDSESAWCRVCLGTAVIFAFLFGALAFKYT